MISKGKQQSKKMKKNSRRDDSKSFYGSRWLIELRRRYIGHRQQDGLRTKNLSKEEKMI